MAGFWNQANALFRKNLTYQKRHVWSNLRLILFPAFVFLLFGLVQYYANKDNQSSPSDQKMITQTDWPPLLQIPSPEFRAVKTDSLPFKDLPDASCRSTGSCPATILITGNNQTLGESVAEKFFTNSSIPNVAYNMSTFANYVSGTDVDPDRDIIRDAAFYNYGESTPHLFYVQPQCPVNSTYSFTDPDTKIKDVLIGCVQGLPLWRKSYSEINDELFKGYFHGNKEGNTNEIMGAYDFLDTSSKRFNVKIWYNATYRGFDQIEPKMLRIPRAENMVSNAYLQSLLGPAAQMILEFIGEMPIHTASPSPDMLADFGAMFFTWIILQLFPVIWTSLVYEKQQKLRIMMKMHGLGNAAYWVISYLYFLVISTMYMCFFVGMGAVTGLPFFTLNSYGVQCVFYFVYINLQISFAFLLAALFSDVKTASVVAYIMVFATGLLGGLLFKGFVNDIAFPGNWIILMELYPGFALFRGLDELVQYAGGASKAGSSGIIWDNLSDRNSGIREVLIIMLVEWLVFLISAVYLDQVVSSGNGVRRGPLFFLRNFQKKTTSASQRHGLQMQDSHVCVEMEKDDVAQEREKVEQLLRDPQANYSTICHNLKKVYPGKDGNPEKFAVKGLTLALPRGECFGMLGPNGAGKTSFISMMTGLTEPSSGTAYVEGLDLRIQMDEIYVSLGVCPQHDLLWDTLSGREHLLFYGRLKNLQGAALNQAVEESLKSLDLFHGGVADKAAGKYSGGMKRRLSVAISLIGDPKIVYMDEPSTGLDPASRNTLWNVVTQAKKDRVIILTTHSMEEAEHLCDRIGIFVNGGFRCLGSTEELKARYGETYVFIMTTSPDHEMDVENLVKSLSPNAKKTYHLSGTQKFELPKNEVKISQVFQAVKRAKERFEVQTWGLADTSLEDVFIKVATEA